MPGGADLMARDDLATEAEIQEAMAQAERSYRAEHPVEATDTGLHPLIDLYDTEILAIEAILPALNEHTGKSFQAKDWTARRDAFSREVEGRFAEIGLVARVVGWYVDPDDPDDNAPTPRIEIQGRTDKVDFDYDRQVHEVTNDVLDTGEKGTIGSTKLWTPGT